MIFIVSVVRPRDLTVLLIPELLRRRMLLSPRTQPGSTRGLAPGRGRRSRARPIRHRKHAPALGERSGRLRSLLSRIGISLASEFAFVYSAPGPRLAVVPVCEHLSTRDRRRRSFGEPSRTTKDAAIAGSSGPRATGSEPYSRGSFEPLGAKRNGRVSKRRITLFNANSGAPSSSMWSTCRSNERSIASVSIRARPWPAHA